MGSVPFGETQEWVAILQDQVISHRQNLFVDFREADLQVLSNPKLLPDCNKPVGSAIIAVSG